MNRYLKYHGILLHLLCTWCEICQFLLLVANQIPEMFPDFPSGKCRTHRFIHHVISYGKISRSLEGMRLVVEVFVSLLNWQSPWQRLCCRDRYHISGQFENDKSLPRRLEPSSWCNKTGLYTEYDITYMPCFTSTIYTRYPITKLLETGEIIYQLTAAKLSLCLNALCPIPQVVFPHQCFKMANWLIQNSQYCTWITVNCRHCVIFFKYIGHAVNTFCNFVCW